MYSICSKDKLTVGNQIDYDQIKIQKLYHPITSAKIDWRSPCSWCSIKKNTRKLLHMRHTQLSQSIYKYDSWVFTIKCPRFSLDCGKSHHWREAKSDLQSCYRALTKIRLFPLQANKWQALALALLNRPGQFCSKQTIGLYNSTLRICNIAFFLQVHVSSFCCKLGFHAHI